MLLVSDHTPHPTRIEPLSEALGIRFDNRFVVNDGVSACAPGLAPCFRSEISFRDLPRAHETRGVAFVTSFSGTSFATDRPGQTFPLLVLPPGSRDAVTRAPVDGLLQGALLDHGYGGVYVSAETAMFTDRVRGERPVGFDAENAPYNERFLRNIVRRLDAYPKFYAERLRRIHALRNQRAATWPEALAAR